MPDVRRSPLFEGSVTNCSACRQSTWRLAPAANAMMRRRSAIASSRWVPARGLADPVACAIAVKLHLAWPGVFQATPQRRGWRVFTIYKFPHHAPACAKAGVLEQAKRGDPRITLVGGFLRTSLDELPHSSTCCAAICRVVDRAPHALEQRSYQKVVSATSTATESNPALPGGLR